MPFLTSRRVLIHVPAGVRHVNKYLNRQLNAAHAKKRAHMVRGHWRAEHVWRGKPRARKWIESHPRGDASLGWVNQHHEVRGE